MSGTLALAFIRYSSNSYVVYYCSIYKVMAINSMLAVFTVVPHAVILPYHVHARSLSFPAASVVGYHSYLTQQ